MAYQVKYAARGSLALDASQRQSKLGRHSYGLLTQSYPPDWVNVFL